MINVQILSMAIRTFFMENLDYAAAGASCGGNWLLCRAFCVIGPLTDGAVASCAVVGVLLDVGPSSKEGHNVLDFGLQERVNWREEATGVGARKP